MSAAPREDAGNLRRTDPRRKLLVVDPRPLFASAIANGFDPAEWRVKITTPDAVCDVPIRSGIGVVALASADSATVVGLLTARDRRVIVYGSDQGAGFFEAVEAGAVGFVSDHSQSTEFTRAATALRNGAVSVFPEHTRRLLSDRARPATNSSFVGLGLLTRREREVLEGLVVGMRPAEIAERDFVSVITVRNQVQAILTKLNVHSQLEAVAAVHRHGWVLRSA